MKPIIKETIKGRINAVKKQVDIIDSRYESGFYRDMEEQYFDIKAQLRLMLQDLFLMEKAA